MLGQVQDAGQSGAGELVSASAVVCELRTAEQRERPLLWGLGAAAAGIVVDRVTALPILCWCLLLATLLLAAQWQRFKHRHWFSALLLLASVSAVAGLWHHDRWHLYAEDEIARRAGDVPVPVVLRVEVLDAPRHGPAARPGPMSTMTRGETTRVEVRVLAVRQASAWQRASGRLPLIVEGRLKAEDALRGDQLEVAALLAAVRPALNPGEPDFARICRSRRQGAVLLCGSTECIQRLRCGGAWSLLRQLGRLRLAAEVALDRHVGVRRSPLAAALLLGSRERLDEETVQTFFVSGTLHLLAISGLHVGILATVFWLLVRIHWLPRNRVLWATCVLVVCYALLTGARPPVVRATILIVVYCLARGLGRSPQAWNSLAAAGLITLGLRPSGLFDTGTQLSFLAVASLIAAWPLFSGNAFSGIAEAGSSATRHHGRDPLEQLILLSQPIWLRAVRAAGIRLGQLLLISTIVWLVSLPLVAYRFHLIAPIGIVLNVLLWLPIAAGLFSALLTVITAPLPIVPDMFGAFCDRTLLVVELLTSRAAQPSWGHSWVVGSPWWWVVVFYVGLMLWQFVPLPISRRWWCALLCGWLALGIACGSCSQRVWRMASRPVTSAPPVVFPPSKMRLSFIAVGHGTSVLVEFPNGKVLLYDAGRMGHPRAAALPISSVLWARRIHHIDALVLSHADADHFNAAPELLQRFSVGIVYVSPVMFREPARRSSLCGLPSIRPKYRSVTCTKTNNWPAKVTSLSRSCIRLLKGVLQRIVTAAITVTALSCS